MKRFQEFTLEPSERKSIFDPSVSVSILYKRDEEYTLFEDEFENRGWCIGVLEDRTIIWDGEAMRNLDRDQITFIEAHEYAHFKLGKKAKEVDCDWLAIAECWDRGLKNAAKAGIDVFEDRHGMEFDTSDLNGYDKWIGNRRKLAESFISDCKARDIDLLSALKAPERFGLNPLKSTIKTAWEIYAELITS